MKRVLALTLSLFALANTITVSQTQALPKPVKIAAKLASGVTFGGLAAYSAYVTYSLSHVKGDYVNNIAAAFSAFPAIAALGCGIVSAISFKSAYDDVKN